MNGLVSKLVNVASVYVKIFVNALKPYANVLGKSVVVSVGM